MLSERLKKAWEEAEFHKQCNAALTENQQALHAKLGDAQGCLQERQKCKARHQI